MRNLDLIRNQHLVLAGRLDGRLKTAFPSRSGADHLAESKDEVHILLVADTDMLTDRLWVQVQNFFGQKVMNAFANNGDFIINAVDNLVGSSDLIAVRTRPSSARPFTTVEALKRQADDRFRSKEQELQSQLSETERRLTELQSTRNDQSSTLLTPEQSAELERFQAEKLRIRKELRQVRHQLDADIDALGSRLKFLNIIGVPLLVTDTPVSLEAEPNDDPLKPQKLALPAVVSGRFDKERDADWYEIEPTENGSYSFDVYCERIAGRADPYLVVLDEKDNRVAELDVHTVGRNLQSLLQPLAQLARQALRVLGLHLPDVPHGHEGRGGRGTAEGHGQPRDEAGHDPAFRLAEPLGQQARQLA